MEKNNDECDVVNWSDYMSKEDAENFDFGAPPVVFKLAFLSGRQAFIMRELPFLKNIKRIAISDPLIRGLASNALAMVKLYREGFLNEIYIILRSLIERVITFFYLQCCDEDDLQNYLDYSMQKTYWLLDKNTQINDKYFSIKSNREVDLNNFPEFKKIVDKYTSPKKKKPITRWSLTSINQKLEVIEHADIINIFPLMIALTSFYDDGSEALHATLYGCLFQFGLFQPNKIKSTNEAEKHINDNLSAVFFYTGILLGSVNSYVANKGALDEIFLEEKRTSDQIKNTMNLCLKENPS